jgi:hypothetical protein
MERQGKYQAHYSLSHAAAMAGVDRHTLKRWLVELGYEFPDNPRRGKVLIGACDLEAVIRRHSPQRVLGVLRKAG